jgi:hypothetical protein
VSGAPNSSAEEILRRAERDVGPRALSQPVGKMSS